MNPPATLATPRLRLRRPVIADAATIFAEYAQDAQVTRYLMWRPHASLETTRLFIERCLTSWARGTAFPWVITRADDGQLLGMIEARPDGHRVDLGYVLARPYWGRGLTSEAARAVVSWAIGEADVFRVWAVCDVDNRASARVLEKAGLEREGVLRRWLVHPNLGAEPRDCLSYSRVKEP
jgi:RimJ/RimL family protein N-acetyltransferase